MTSDFGWITLSVVYSFYSDTERPIPLPLDDEAERRQPSRQTRPTSVDRPLRKPSLYSDTRRSSLLSSLSSFSSSDDGELILRGDANYEENVWLTCRKAVLSANLSHPVLLSMEDSSVHARTLLIHLLQGKASLGPFSVGLVN